MNITIKTSHGNWKTNSIQNNMKVADIVNATRKHFGLSEGHFELHRDGENLEYDKTLADYNIKDGDTVLFFELGYNV